MEWIIGLVAIWVLWRLLTSKPRREYEIQDAINRAYILKKDYGENWLKTPIYWEVAEKYAMERGINSYIDGTIYLDFTRNGQKITVTLLRDNINGTTMVQVW